MVMTARARAPDSPRHDGRIRGRLGPDGSQELSRLAARYAQARRDEARARASLERLVALCRPTAERIAWTYAAQEADVADLAQEVLVALTRHLPQLREPAAFPSWFATLAHRVCGHWRAQQRARWVERSLDAPTVPWWLEEDAAPEQRDVPDPDQARDFLRLDLGDELRRLLPALPERQRTALLLAYVDDRSHEQIGLALGVSPRAAEGLVYRALQRLRAIAAECQDEPLDLDVWCPSCGERRLRFQALPGVRPEGPLWLRWRCPACSLASHWTAANLTPLARYASPDVAWWDQRRLWAEEARALARTQRPTCWKCGAPVRRADLPPEAGSASADAGHYVLHWSCFRCDVGTFYAPLFGVAAGLLPEWSAFWRSAPRLLLGPERLVSSAGEARVLLTARDRDTGRRATLAVARDTLEVREFAVEERYGACVAPSVSLP